MCEKNSKKMMLMMMSMTMKMPKNIEGGSRVSSVSSRLCSVYVNKDKELEDDVDDDEYVNEDA